MRVELVEDEDVDELVLVAVLELDLVSMLLLISSFRCCCFGEPIVLLFTVGSKRLDTFFFLIENKLLINFNLNKI